MSEQPKHTEAFLEMVAIIRIPTRQLYEGPPPGTVIPWGTKPDPRYVFGTPEYFRARRLWVENDEH